LKAGDVIPLFLTKKPPRFAVKDILIIPKKCSIPEVMIAKLYVNSKNLEETIDISYKTKNSCVSISNNARKHGVSAWMFAPNPLFGF